MKYPGDVINLRLCCRSNTNMSPQRPITMHMEVWYRCREDWFRADDNLPLTYTSRLGMYTFTYMLSETTYSDPSDATQIAEEIRFRFVFTTSTGAFTKDILFDYAES